MTSAHADGIDIDDVGVDTFTTVLPFRQAPEEYRGLVPWIAGEWMVIYPKDTIENWNADTPIIKDPDLADLPKALGTRVSYFRVPHGGAIAVTSR